MRPRRSSPALSSPRDVARPLSPFSLLVPQGIVESNRTRARRRVLRLRPRAGAVPGSARKCRGVHPRPRVPPRREVASPSPEEPGIVNSVHHRDAAPPRRHFPATPAGGKPPLSPLLFPAVGSASDAQICSSRAQSRAVAQARLQPEPDHSLHATSATACPSQSQTATWPYRVNSVNWHFKFNLNYRIVCQLQKLIENQPQV